MGVDDRPADRHSHRRATGQRAERLVWLGRAVGAVREVSAWTRSRVRRGVASVVTTLRSALGASLQSGDGGGTEMVPVVRPGKAARTIESRTVSGSNVGQSRSSVGRADEQSSLLPGKLTQRRRLPAQDGRLRVERTAERLTLSDPAQDDAYLSSTVWVDVEE